MKNTRRSHGLLRSLYSRAFSGSGVLERPADPVTPPVQEDLIVDFPNCVCQAFPEDFPAAWAITEECIRLRHKVDLAPLARNSPGLKGFDWDVYLRCSVVRMLQALQAARERNPAPARVLDYGSYFGNFALLFQQGGYSVDAVDSYATYGPALAPFCQTMEQAAIHLLDFDDTGFDLHAINDQAYDLVLCMGVIEHVPHTPRLLLETLDRVLKPGGVLILDTPNLGYIYHRQRLNAGESIFCPIAAQYYTELPFEGHHREYTMPEVQWMLEQLGHRNTLVTSYNYSFYHLERLSGIHRSNYLKMQADPTAREAILAVSRKPA